MSVVLGRGACDLAFGDNADRRCAWCGTPLQGRRTRWCSEECGREWPRQHSWTDARTAALKRDDYQCVKCGSTTALEVNHIVPILGGHGAGGCHHHVDGLETFCHDCHVKVTAEQRAQGLFPKRKKLLTEQVVTRVSTRTLQELEQRAGACEMTVADVVRRAVYLFLNPPEPARRERFEETP